MIKVGITTAITAVNRVGTGVYTENLARAIRTTQQDRADVTEINQSKTGINKEIVVPIPKPFSGTNYLYWFATLPHYVKNTELDVIHNTTPCHTSMKFKQKYVLTVHDIIPLILPQYITPFYRLINKAMVPRGIRLADRIISDSTSTKNDIIRILKINPEKITVIPPGIDHDVFKPIVKSNYTLEEKYGITYPIILYAGTIEPRKNISTLMDAYETARKMWIIKNTKHWPYQLVVVGANGWMYEPILEKQKELAKCGSNTVFTGAVPTEDLVQLYSSATCFVFPTLYEGFGFPPLEAMACGCPVITSNRSSVPEVVGNAALQVNPSESFTIARAILTLIGNQTIRSAYSTAGIERANRFNWNDTARKTVDVYKQSMEET